MRPFFSLLVILLAAPTLADDFTDALAHTYQHNPQLAAERERQSATDTGMAKAAGGFQPNVEANYERGRETSKFGNTASSTGDTTYKDLSVVQPIFRGGRTWAEFHSAKRRSEAGEAQLKAVEQQVLLNAVAAYADVVQAQAVLGLSRNNVEVLTRQQEAANIRMEAGELTPTDVAQADSRLARAKADLSQAESTLAAALATFQRIVGFQPGILALPPLPAILPARLEDAEIAARQHNPDVVAAKYFSEAYDYDADATLGAFLPEVNLVGSTVRSEGRSSPNVSERQSDSLTLNVRVPLYQSGLEYANLREARALFAQSKFQVMDVERGAVELATRSWQDLAASESVIAAGESAIRASEKALEGTKIENEQGTRTTLEVLDAEQELFLNNIALVQAKRNQIVHSYRLLAAVGKLTAEALALPIRQEEPAPPPHPPTPESDAFWSEPAVTTTPPPDDAGKNDTLPDASPAPAQ